MDHDCFEEGCQYEGSMFCIWCGLTEDDLDLDGEAADGIADDIAMGRGGYEFGSLYDTTGLAYNRESYFRQW